MRWLEQEDGATIVFVAIVMVLLVAFTGFVIDTARIYEERRELSRGADAAALAIAADCGNQTRPCDTATAIATGEAYADANADDGAAAIDQLDLDIAARTVHVRTKTIDATDGTDQLKMTFMRLLGFSGTTVRADATAIWGYPLFVEGELPLIISDCEYDRLESTVDGEPVTFYFHDGQLAEPCPARPGHDDDGDGTLSGGFGWLATTGCTATAEPIPSEPPVSDPTSPTTTFAAYWVFADPGASPSTGCSPEAFRDLVLGNTVIVPYFTDVSGVGSGGRYEVIGVGALYVVGYNFGGQYKACQGPLCELPCSGDDRCIAGIPTEVEVDGRGPLGGEYRGVVVVRLTG